MPCAERVSDALRYVPKMSMTDWGRSAKRPGARFTCSRRFASLLFSAPCYASVPRLMCDFGHITLRPLSVRVRSLVGGGVDADHNYGRHHQHRQ